MIHLVPASGRDNGNVPQRRLKLTTLAAVDVNADASSTSGRGAVGIWSASAAARRSRDFYGGYRVQTTMTTCDEVAWIFRAGELRDDLRAARP